MEPDPLFRALCWLKGRIEWKFHPAQQLIHESIEKLPPEVKEAVILCCRRFGKSYYGVARSIMKCLEKPGRVQRIIGPTIKQTKDIVRYNEAKITRELRDLGLRKLVQWYATDNMYRIGDGSCLFLGGYDSQEDNQRGGEADEILVEETGSSKPEHYVYQMRDVLKPQLLKTRGKMIHVTTLPDIPDHPFIVETMPQAVMDNAFYSYTIYQDPLATPEIIADAIKDSGGANSETFLREYMNELVRDPTKMVVPHYEKEKVWATFSVPTFVNWQVFMDWGGTRDFTVALLSCYDYMANKILICGEKWWKNNTPSSIIIPELKIWKEQYNPKTWWIDASGQMLVDLKTDHDIDAALPDKVDWKANLNKMANAYKNDQIRIVRDACPLLSMTIRSGTLNKQRNDFDRSPVLGHMDAAAANMYMVRHIDKSDPSPIIKASVDSTFVREVAKRSSAVGKKFGRYS
jgi:hypothetical protein